MSESQHHTQAQPAASSDVEECELSDSELDGVAGGIYTTLLTTILQAQHQANKAIVQNIRA